MASYGSSIAAAVARVSQRQLDYWDSLGIVSPSIARPMGKGSERRYSFQDLIRLTVVSRLRRAGLSLQRIKKGLAVLRRTSKNEDPLLCEVLAAGGKSLFRRIDAKTLEDVLARGQMVFSIAINELEKETAKTVTALEKAGIRGRGRPMDSAPTTQSITRRGSA